MSRSRKNLNRIISLAVFVMLGVIMFISDIMMDFLPNVHLVGVLTVVYTAVYRRGALIPIYIYAFLNGLFFGFGPWWVSYLYIWTILWGAAMLVPRGLGDRVKRVLYIVICTLHGLLFGALYLPVQAVFFSSDPTYLKGWWSIGFVTADIYHGIGNCVFGILLILPLSALLDKLESKIALNV